jgi:hypothetical protein
MSYDESMRENARLLFMQGLSKKEIQTQLKIGSNVTVLKWAREDNWEGQRQKMNDEAVQSRLREEIDKVLSDSQNTLAGLQMIGDRALASITDKYVNPEKFGEAADSYIKAEKFKKEVRSQLLSIQFIQAVANILQEEIDDPETLNRIGRRIRLLLSSNTVERSALSA